MSELQPRQEFDHEGGRLWTAALVLLLTGISAYSQKVSGQPTPLATWLAEAKSSNSQVAAANDAWKAATRVARQLATLPDPQLPFNRSASAA